MIQFNNDVIPQDMGIKAALRFHNISTLAPETSYILFPSPK